MIILARQLNSRESRAVYDSSAVRHHHLPLYQDKVVYAHILKGYFYTNLVGTLNKLKPLKCAVRATQNNSPNHRMKLYRAGISGS
jgi:hypothetical protein